MMLDAHPDLAIPPETHFVSAVATAPRHDPQGRQRFLETVLRSPRWSDFHLDTSEFARRIAAINPFDPAEAVRVFHTLYAARFHKPRWGNKTPAYLLHLRAIADLLPEAHFIHIIRDGRDVALSVRDLWFGPTSIDAAAHWWVSRLDEARRQAVGLPHYMEVRYEDLVAFPEPVLHRLCAFLDLPWSPELLEYERRAPARLAELEQDIASPDGTRVISASERREIFAATAQKPDPRRSGRWVSQMSDADRTAFEGIAGEMLRTLGYPTSSREGDQKPAHRGGDARPSR